MVAWPKILFAAALAGLLVPPQAKADDNIIVNGLPCNSICRAWMGIKTPPAEQKPVEAKTVDPAPDENEDVSPEAPRRFHKKAMTAQRGSETAVSTAHPKHHKELVAHRAKEAQPAQVVARRPEAKGAHFWESQDFANEMSSKTSKASPANVVSSPKAPAEAPVATVAATPAPPSSDAKAVATATAATTEPPAPPPTVAAPAPMPVSTPDQAAAAPSEKLAEAPKAESPAPVASVVETPLAAVDKAAVDKAPANDAPAAVPPEAPADVAKVETPADVAKLDTPAPNPVVAAAPATPDASKQTTPTQDVSTKPPVTPPEASPVTANEGDSKPRPAGADASPTAETQVAAASGSAEVKTPSQVLVVLAKPEFKDVADLKDRSVVLAGVYAFSRNQLQASFAAKGASGLAFKQGGAADVEQLWNGQVSAAVVAVAEPQIAAAFHEVPGYHLLLVQVLPPAAAQGAD